MALHKAFHLRTHHHHQAAWKCAMKLKRRHFSSADLGSLVPYERAVRAIEQAFIHGAFWYKDTVPARLKEMEESEQ